ncbi:hypothetical protein [Clostridium kluyveri]|uniref:Uncharacterized protein n=1 Tax=Clostridium kluyveri TaxID=1534 RepID=A0A1L5F8S9_CLOKL|nr:hypothetical protein [Clostridium kluyveri]APM39418.1 hypothetical protein BS101_12030 [Clostridium kluyveri]
MATAYSRGNLIKYVDNSWVYEDGVPISKEERPCIRCGSMPTREGYDACLGHIEGAISACCGHGVEEGYVKYESEGN